MTKRQEAFKKWTGVDDPTSWDKLTDALSRTDDLSALAEHDRQVRRAALIEVKQLALIMATLSGQSLNTHQFIDAINNMIED